MPQTYREDGTVRSGDSVLLKSVLTEGWLVTDMGDRITTHDEAYAVTTTKQAIGACARSVMQLVKTAADGQDDMIRFGDELRIQSNAFICNKTLYLSSQPISPLAFARFSRNQEVCLHSRATYNTVWRILPIEGNRKARMGLPVSAGEQVAFEHAATH